MSVALVVACVPAMAYVIQAEDILTSSDWAQKVAATSFPGTAVSGIVGAANGGQALSVIDNDKANPKDAHVADNTGDLLYVTTAAGAFNGSATAVVRMKTTAEFEFSALTGTPTDDGWDRNVILSFGDGVWRRCAGFAVRPDSVTFTNTTASSVYGGVYAIDNTQWHTWTIVGSGFTSASGSGSIDVYVDGGSAPVMSIASGLASTDTAIGYIDALSIGSAMGGSSRDGTGSWLFDWVAVKAGADPGWQPNVPEPGSLLALASGLIGLVGFGIRRRK